MLISLAIPGIPVNTHITALRPANPVEFYFQPAKEADIPGTILSGPSGTATVIILEADEGYVFVTDEVTGTVIVAKESEQKVAPKAVAVADTTGQRLRFNVATGLLLSGKASAIARQTWNVGEYLKNEPLFHPHLITQDGTIWNFTQADIYAADWYIVHFEIPAA